MKKIIVFLVIIFMSSCSLIKAESTDFVMPHGIYNPIAAWKWVSANIQYKSDALNLYHIQTPQETIDKGTGDCKAFSILLAAMLDYLGYDNVWMVYIKWSNGSSHALVDTDIFVSNVGSYIEPQHFNNYPAIGSFKEYSRMSYKEYKNLVASGWIGY
jgi:hypothetical protein